MYYIYTLNQNLAIRVIEVAHLNAPILLDEACIVTNIRKGINFIKEPNECLKLTDLERLIMSTEFFDTSMIKESDFRKAFTYLENSCQIDLDYPYIDPNFDITTFGFEAYAVRDEGDERIGFTSGGLNLDNISIMFKKGADIVGTDSLSYYLQEREEFDNYKLLNTSNGGESYSFSYFRIPTLQDGTGETKLYDSFTFYDISKGLHSMPFSLSGLIPCANITSYNSVTGVLSYNFYENIVITSQVFTLYIKDNFGAIYNVFTVDSESTSMNIGVIPSGYSLFIYDGVGQNDNSNTIYIP